MDSRTKSNQDSNSDLPERATQYIQLLSLLSDIVAQDLWFSLRSRCLRLNFKTLYQRRDDQIGRESTENNATVRS
ncbi:hypothetical protein M514_23130 [Trichuris suis]|uniref:Uncharacterized protein n=1 Tax=Trichuris suis TaxID=68888 RepID=A0A085N5C6_9BILA|nr:hypothetical protein M514_23130 [Trichuris suis]